MNFDWIVINQISARPLNNHRYLSEGAANDIVLALGKTFSELYTAIPLYEDAKWRQILVEGLHAGDLEGILLPQFSVDVYVPSDAKTDNIVIGLMVKGVPEAVYPLQNFCRYSRGVDAVDYGDSDTLPHTSIVYVEFDRAKFDIADVFELIEQVCRLSGFEPKDLSVNFPTSNKSFPYTPEMIKEYFGKRDRDKNRLSQYKANKEQSKRIQKELEAELDFGNISKRLGGGPKQPARPPHAQGLKQLKRPVVSQTPKQKKLEDLEVPDTVKASIIADARRNRINHQVKWQDFDSRWANRLHVIPSKVASIRKQIYDMS